MNAITDFIRNIVDHRKSTRRVAVIIDPTLYRIETISHTYCGRILFQNDLVIKLQTEKPRVVKILKENIQQITIAKGKIGRPESLGINS